MALLPRSPQVKILLAMEAAATAVDYAGLAGTTDPVVVRHSRNRKPMRSEKFVITFIFVGDDAAPGDNGHTEDEVVRNMTVDMQIDAPLATEDSEADPTGLELLLRMKAAACAAVRAGSQDSTGLVVGTVCDWISEGAINPDDRSTSDEGRLVQELVIEYRTSSIDGNVLFASGENA